MGTWWLPSAEKKVYRGTLRLSPNGITLRILGDRDEVEHWKRYSSQSKGPINGILFDGRKATLTEAFASGASSAALAEQNIVVNLCIIGRHFSSDDKISFDAIDLYLTNFENWLQHSPFKMHKRSTKRIRETYSFEYPKTLFEVSVPSLGATIKSTHQSQFMFPGYTSLELKHRPGISVHTERGIDKERLWHLPYSLGQLFSLLIGYPVHPMQIRCFDEGDPSSYAEIYYSLFERVKNNERVHPSDILFSFKDMRRKLGNVFENWFSKEKVERPIRNLFYSQFSKTETRSLTHFLNYIQAIEIFARVHYPQKSMSDIKFRGVHSSLLSAIPRQCTEEQRSELEGKISNLNQPSLRQRMGMVMKRMPKRARNALGIDNDYIGKLVRTRNYFTHYSSDRNILSEDELWLATDKSTLR